MKRDRKGKAEAKGRPKYRPRRYIGVIAEDDSDIAVIDALVGKLAKAPYVIRPVSANGCGKIIGKCRGWAQNLRDRGCQCLLIVHDLDLRNITQLNEQLRASLEPSPISPHIVVIPVREIEAWLLADH